jgi:single-stranded-DNA-specific exonuclease
MRRPRIWSFRSSDPDVERVLSQRLALSPLAARVLALRGAATPEAGRAFLDAPLAGLTPPGELPQLGLAVERLERAVRGRERVLVFGDSDVDGLSGAALLARFLRALGGEVDVHVSERTVDGYGLSPAGEQAVRRREPALLVTVDHGVTAHEPIERLQRDGIDVIVTDHHQNPETLPPALAVLNPLLLEESHAAARLSGAGVAFKLACGLFEALPQARKQDPMLRSVLREGLALAALGTVADVVPLVGENRLLVRHGLAQIRSSRLAGIAALRATAALEGRELDAEDVSFGFAPRINAAGRMGKVDLARRLLLTDDPSEARAIATELESLNQRRRALEAQVHARAVERLAEESADAAIVCLGDEAFHPGVIGIVAAKLVTRTGKPVVLVSTHGTVARGSGRSVPGFDLAQALAAVREHFTSCGGHAQAAGLEMDPGRFGAMKRALEEVAAERFRDLPDAPLEIDSEAMLHEITPRLLAELRPIGPFGAGNPAPCFAASGVELGADPRRVGADGSHLLMRVKSGARTLSAIAFGHGHRAGEVESGRLALAFTPRPSSYGGAGAIELLVADLKPDAPAADRA